MKALAVTPGQKNTARLIDVPKPQPDPKQALVRVLQVGIDATGREINEGLYGQAPAGENFLILGHESFGQIEKVGSEVQGFQPGDYVVATVRRPDDCINCQAGETDFCLKGDYLERGIKGLHGYMAEYYVEDERYLVKVPPELRDTAVLLEPLSIVEKAIVQAFKIQERMVWCPKTAVVTGAGSIGLMAAMLLRLKELDVYVYSRERQGEPEAQIAEEFGARYISSQDMSLEQLSEQTRRNIDIMIEATGAGHIALRSKLVLGTNGILTLLGISARQAYLTLCEDCLDLKIVLGNKVIFGSVNSNRSHFEVAVRDMLNIERRWPGLLSRIITRHVPLQAGPKVLEKKPGDVKVVVDVTRV